MSLRLTPRAIAGTAGVVLVIALVQALGGTSEPTDPATASPAVAVTATASPTPTPTPSSTPTPSLSPEPSPTLDPATETVTETTDTSSDALTALAALPVKGKAARTDYEREAFSKGWKDPDRNGCDARNDVLARDLTDVTYRPGTHDCVVETGTLTDPYSGQTIAFSKRDNASAVQIDHVVALANAWVTGAQGISADQRYLLANDPLNLLAVDGSLNNQKRDGDAATWLPPAKGFRCAYVARQIAVKTRYGLWVTQPEKDAMTHVLEGCPGQTLPTGGLAGGADGVAAGGSGGSPGASAGDAAQTGSAATGGAASGGGAQPAAPAGDTSYANCTDVWNRLGHPIHAGDPGYSRKLDRDGDGVGCEHRP